LYRIGRKPNPWQIISWSYAQDDRTFGNRFDDADGSFRVLYAASTRLCCFLETLARFRRPPAAVLQQLSLIEHAEDDHTPPGVVPASWLAKRRMGQAIVDPHLRFADIYASTWLFAVEHKLSEFGLLPVGQDFDLALLLAQHRLLTQRAATFIYGQGFDGIYYLSRYGTDLENWALFERREGEFGILRQEEPEPITENDPDLQKSLQCFGLKIDPAC